MKTMKKTIWLIGVIALFGVMTFVNGQDDENEKPPQPAKWTTMSDAKMTMGFAKDWDTFEKKDGMTGVSPDGKIRITATLSDFPTVKETLANLEREFDSWCEGLKLSDPEYAREANGLKVDSTGGTAKLKDGGQDIDVAIDIVEIGGKTVIVAIYGFSEAMDKNFEDILLTQGSYKQAE